MGAWAVAVCRLSGITWLCVQAFGGLVTAAIVYLFLDGSMPVSRVLAQPRVLTQPMVAGRGFRIEYQIEKRRQCPGAVSHFLVAVQGDNDGVVIPITREPVGTFRRVGDPAKFSMQPYVPGYVSAGRYVVRTVASYGCTFGTQQVVLDTEPVMVVGRDGR